MHCINILKLATLRSSKKEVAAVVFGFLSDKEIPRYERQLKNVNHLVLHTIRDKKDVDITMDELEKILEALYEFRVID